MKNMGKKIIFIFKKSGKKDGIALLFSILVSSVILSIAFGMINIAAKEINFSTSAKSTNEAFFAADVGVECALYNDKISNTVFPGAPDYPTEINCLLNGNLPLVKLSDPSSDFRSWNFVMKNLGSSTQACVKVNVLKEFNTSTDPPILKSTKITSRGYNIGDSSCTSSDVNRLERVLEVNY
jgi:hypothetical protein